MITLHTFTTSTAYNQDLYAFLKTPDMEGFDLNPYLDGVNIPTMGVGFNLRKNLSAVATEILGTHLTSTLLSQLQAQVNANYPNHSAASVALLQANLNNVLQNWHNTHDAGTHSYSICICQ